MKKIYSFNLNPVTHIEMKSLVSLSGLVVIEVPMEHQNCLMKNILLDTCKSTSGNCFESEFLIFDGFTKDEALTVFSNINAHCSTKIKNYAIVNEENIQLTAYQLYKRTLNENTIIEKKSDK